MTKATPGLIKFKANGRRYDLEENDNGSWVVYDMSNEGRMVFTIRGARDEGDALRIAKADLRDSPRRST